VTIIQGDSYPISLDLEGAEMNVKLLKEVKEAILEHSKQFDMSEWHSSVAARFESAAIPTCNTTCCIGGWAAVLYNQKLKEGDTRYRLDYMDGEQALSLTDDQAARLFLVYEWPEIFRAKYELSSTAKKRAEVACARIDHFIKSKGSE
jgi:hypothetical protein